MIEWAAVVVFAAVAAGGVVCLMPNRLREGLLLQALGALGVAVVGLLVLGRDDVLGAPFSSGLEPRLGIDGTSAVFLVALGSVAAPAALYATQALQPTRTGRVVGALTSAFVLALGLLLCARDPLTFLFGWELITLVPAAVILVVSGTEKTARHTVFVYLAITHLGGTGTWVAVLLLADAGALGGVGSIETGSTVQVAIVLAALLGMGTKAGLMPMHSWLPRAHPIAPAHISALMSGVMVKVALYGLIRVLVDWVGVVPLWLGALTLALGALSALGGVVYACFQPELKRLLAFSTIENVGIVVLALGACLLLRARGSDQWAAVALAAALLHSVNHAVFKGLLFLGAGAFERAAGMLELDRLGGLLRRMPWTGGAFLVGSLAIAGIPPLSGFTSEWLTLQALLRVAADGGIGDGLAGGVALAVLGATAALALLCFVKVVGLVLLGAPRTAKAAAAVEAPFATRAGVTALAFSCVALGVAPGLLFGHLVGTAAWLGPAGWTADDAGQAGLSPSASARLPSAWLALVLLCLAGIFVAARGRRTAAVAPTWACGQPVVAELRWTSAGFTKPLRLVLEAVLRPRREIVVRTTRGVVRGVSYTGHVPHLFDEHLYRPVTRVALAAAAAARRVQTGDLSTYVAYLAALVIVLLGAIKLGVLA